MPRNQNVDVAYLFKGETGNLTRDGYIFYRALEEKIKLKYSLLYNMLLPLLMHFESVNTNRQIFYLF